MLRIMPDVSKHVHYCSVAGVNGGKYNRLHITNTFTSPRNDEIWLSVSSMTIESSKDTRSFSS